MKIDGQEVKGDEAIYGPFVIERGGKKFGFFAKPIGDFAEFDRLCPAPEPPMTGWNPKTGKQEHDPKSPAFRQVMMEHSRKKWGWIVLKSLEPTNLDLSDHGISLEDPDSWGRVEEALRWSESNPDGLPHYEFAQVMELVDEANALSADRLEANRESFLLERARQQSAGQSFQNSEASSSKSGQHASDGE